MPLSARTRRRPQADRNASSALFVGDHVTRSGRVSRPILAALAAALTLIAGVVAVSATGQAGSAATCTVSAKLVPTCGRWFGIAPRAKTKTTISVGLPIVEREVGSQFNMIHTYHSNSQLFPGKAERALTISSGRLLLTNWKPATDMTWAAVAAGKADARIDAEAAYLKANFPYRFLLAIWHEPENDVNPAAGSGMTASDYAAMYRHVVLRLRSHGATNAVTVMNYMGYQPWVTKSWFTSLWPGDDVVDWISYDPYGSAVATFSRPSTFGGMVDHPVGSFPGFYTYFTKLHPGVPIMLSEWGVQDNSSNPALKAAFFATVPRDIVNFPMLKAISYFDMAKSPDPRVSNTAMDDTSQTLKAFTACKNSPVFAVSGWSYAKVI